MICFCFFQGCKTITKGQGNYGFIGYARRRVSEVKENEKLNKVLINLNFFIFLNDKWVYWCFYRFYYVIIKWST